MEIKVTGNVIALKNKEVNELDKRVIDFVKLLKNLDYVIISGYIAILFGRSRSTEDVDLFVDLKSEKDFSTLFENFEENDYYIINAIDKDEAYNLLKDGVAIRIAKNGEIMPNFEMKLPKTKIDRLSLKNSMLVKFDSYQLNTSSIELQIAYKLFLGSEKDYGDAAHLYDVYLDYLNKDKFNSFIKMLSVDTKVVKEVLEID